jgi:hypothetical protein
MRRRYPVLLPAAPPVPTRPVDASIDVPAGGRPITATIGWNFALNAHVVVAVRNVGAAPVHIVDAYPNGASHRLAPGRGAELSIAPGFSDLPLRLQSEHGTRVEIAVPRVLAKKKIVVRDQQQLIDHVVETPVWMPANA